MIITKKSTLKSYILESLSQIEIFAKLLDVSESDIEDCLKGAFIINRVRNEKSASVRMMYVRDNTGMTKIRMTDFGDRRYSGDCFDIMGLLLSTDVTSSDGFVKICKAILNLTNLKKNSSQNTITITEKGITDIAFISRPWNEYDRKWTGAFGLTPEEYNLIVNCVAVETALIGKRTWDKPSYTYRVIDPCYAYIIGKYKGSNIIKLYFPKRSKTSKFSRFITNNPFPFDDLTDFKKADVLILVKSLKDKAVLIYHLFLIPEFVQYLKDGGTINVRPVSSESGTITELQARVLQGLFDMIVTNFDFDNQGCYTANFYRRQYGFIPIMLTNGKYGSFNYKAKDTTEYRTKFGLNKTLDLLKNAITRLKGEYERLATYR
jgi:hypothetical protein